MSGLEVLGALGTTVDLAVKAFKYTHSVLGQSDEQRQLITSIGDLHALLPALKEHIDKARNAPAEERSNYQNVLVHLGKEHGSMALCEKALKQITEDIEKANPRLKEEYSALVVPLPHASPSTPVADTLSSPPPAVLRSPSPTPSTKSSSSSKSTGLLNRFKRKKEVKAGSPLSVPATPSTPVVGGLGPPNTTLADSRSSSPTPSAKSWSFSKLPWKENTPSFQSVPSTAQSAVPQPPPKPSQLPSFVWKLLWPVTALDIEGLRKHISDFKETVIVMLQLGFSE
jgi:hypothetical protein